MRYGMLINLRLCIGCGACVMACKMENGTGRDTYWCNVLTKETGKYPNAKMSVMSLSCMHCQNAPCVTACPTCASHYDGSGNVQVDSSKCIGCRVCMAACPYNVRHYNYTSQKDDPYWEGQGMTPFEKEKCADHKVGAVEKCNRCTNRLADGRNVACAETCPTGSRMFGDLDDPESAISKAIKDLNARPLYEEIGTKPTVYYVGSF